MSKIRTKPPYYDYVNYMLRAFFKPPRPDDLDVTVRNRAVCDQVLSGIAPEDLEFLRGVYSLQTTDKIPDIVEKRAVESGRNRAEVWGLVRSVTREIARKRGLIE